MKSKDPAAEKDEAARKSFGAGAWNMVCLVHCWSLAPRTVSTTEWAHDENVSNEGIKHENMSAEQLWQRLGNSIPPFHPHN